MFDQEKTETCEQVGHWWQGTIHGHRCTVCGWYLYDEEFDPLDPDETECWHCGGYYDGGAFCGTCGHGDPLDTGEFDPVTGHQL